MGGIKDSDKKEVEKLLTQRSDDALYLSEFKSGKSSRIIAFGTHGRLYVFSSKKGAFAIEFHGHLLDLKSIVSKAPSKFAANFSNGSVEGELDCTGLINDMRQMFSALYPGKELFQCDVEPESRLRDLQEPPERPCGGFVSTYLSMCDYYNAPPRSDIAWDIDNILPVGKRRKLEFEDFEQPIKPAEFASLVATLSYNKYFTGMSCSHITMDKQMTQAIGDMLVVNTHLEELNLSNCGLSKGLVQPIADAFKANKKSAIQLLDMSHNALGDKDLALLGPGIGGMSRGLISFNATNIGGKKSGMMGLFNGIKKNVFMSGSLQTLIVSNNVFDSDGSGALSAYLAQPTGLQVLQVANCNIKLDQLFASMVRGCQNLERCAFKIFRSQYQYQISF